MCLLCFDINCKDISFKNLSYKRYFLPLIFTPIIIYFYPNIINFYYFPIIFGFSAFILFWNFPKLVYYTASRPLYYEDIFIDEKKLPNYDVPNKLKIKFQHLLEWLLIITNTILVAGLSDWWLYKSNYNFDLIQITGITGGVIKIFQLINNTLTRIMLKLLKNIIKNQNLKIKNKKIVENKKKNENKIKEIITLKIINENEEENYNFKDECGDIELIDYNNFKRPRFYTL